MKHLVVFAAFVALALSLPPVAQAQALPPAPTPNLPTNMYAFGLSYNNGAKPSIAGTASYSRLVSASLGTYAFTILDILPVSFSPSVVTTNLGVGVAQKVLTINGVNFFIPVSTGLTVTGPNTGWNWTGGGLADYNVKKAGVPTNWHIQPNVRFVRASVNNVAQYQLIFGGQLAWGQ